MLKSPRRIFSVTEQAAEANSPTAPMQMPAIVASFRTSAAEPDIVVPFCVTEIVRQALCAARKSSAPARNEKNVIAARPSTLFCVFPWMARMNLTSVKANRVTVAISMTAAVTVPNTVET